MELGRQTENGGQNKKRGERNEKKGEMQQEIKTERGVRGKDKTKTKTNRSAPKQ